MADPGEVRLAVQAGADAVGIVGPMPTGPGTLNDTQSGLVAGSVPVGVSAVLLTAEETGAGIADHVRRVGQGRVLAIQIVRHVDPQVLEEVAAVLPHVRRIQTVHVEGEAALGLIGQYGDHADAFLLDSGRPAEAQFGGTGRTHDWAVSAAFVRASPVPVFLAGGLSADNARAAIERVRPYGLDLCSGVRTAGRLDADKLEAFMAAVAEGDACSTR